MNKYRNLAVLNGILLAIMIFLNGVLSEKIGLYLSTLIYHVLGLLLILLVSIVRKNKLPKLNKIPVILFLPGILSVLVIFLNNLSSSKIGITLTAGMGLLGQLVISALIDHFGLFGVQVNKMRKEKILSFSLIITGLIFMILL
ncbi:DMT family transporter [Clostridium botulinum]|uniref:Putative membrane protein n=1 Tax=Clostridium botulinum (strain Okra / Type B1) TaxID=498213 RepID=B1IH71_CLOBK|nr:DMT family transporter [Clostridium botulinum]ACA45456.1 putative membrane protein [Clostridium botulinum B1 str. Okra]MBD5561722.1 DMT family transporter [Clostridium botulinum]MBD5565388.1 DMT family transporter [Clostridium botulinum]MBD5570606.1 DMT family transporter [Clostridium botulinum]MBD5574873.1 DMT family transporter [Clostridium botulinum]